ncbi:MAG TPA: DOMON-like domain-containing protein [Candidatus Binatia bacterium]|jgi:hypothetical protein
MIKPSDRYTAALANHPEMLSESVGGIEARVLLADVGALTITYVLTGDFIRVQIPPARPPNRVDGLWCHTCFEAFIGVKDDAAYYEFNFSPSGEWAAYAFRDYRDGGPIKDNNLDPNIAVRREVEMLELNAIIRLDRLPAMQPGASLRLGLSAVIEEIDGRITYWALKHPPGRPDFHHPDNFILEIQPPIVDGTNPIAYTGKR